MVNAKGWEAQKLEALDALLDAQRYTNALLEALVRDAGLQPPEREEPTRRSFWGSKQ